MPNVLRLRRSNAPEPKRNSEAVYANAAGVLKRVAPDGSETELGSGEGGGSQPGAITVRKFPIAFDSPGLYTSAGFPLFTTEAGEQILNCWAWGSVNWDAGTTANLDCGSVADLGNGAGWYKVQSLNPPWLFTVADSAINPGSAVVPSFNSLLQQAIEGTVSVLPLIYPAATPIVAVSWDDNVVSEDSPAPYGATAGALDFFVMSVVPS